MTLTLTAEQALSAREALKLRDAGKAIELIAHMLRILSVGDAISPDHIAEVAAIGKKLSK